MNPTKRCSHCHAVQSWTAYRRDKGRADGHDPMCRACRALRHAERRALRSEGRAPERRRAVLTNAHASAIWLALSLGVSWGQIGRRLKCHPKTAQSALRRYLIACPT